MLNTIAKNILAFVSRRKSGGVIINEHTLSREQTRLHVQALWRHFDFINLDELPARLAQPGRRAFCLLTFDDGKRSHATEVAPELEKLGVPAVFYLNTNAISEQTALWFDRQQALVRALGRCPPGLELETLKQLPFAILTQRLNRACAEHGIGSDLTRDDLCPMSWDDARWLHARGFALGAHGCTHAILTREPWPNACVEIEQSIAAVSAETGATCTSFAFPNGNYTPELAQHAKACGAGTIMTTDPFWVDDASALWRLPRIQLFGTFTEARIALKVAVAALGRILPNPNGTPQRAFAYARPGFSPS
jgi:peptidoglycan/xylan/chitin deacetylase (PgdA/CDA1 family)